MGSVNFIGFTIGSLLFVRLADIYGRKPVVIIATLVTPLGIICLLLFGNSLIKIYIIFFIMGLSYSSRSSVSYLLGSEFITEKYQLHFGIMLFVTDGIITILTSIYFRYVGNQ